MIYSDLSEEELCLFVLFTDETGLDQAEFCMVDERNKQTGLFRAWPVQQFWWRKKSKKIISQGSRSIGKSLSAKLRAFAFPFVHPGGELVITAPEGLHLDALTDNIESLYLRNRIAESMLAKDQRGRIKHRPFHINFANGGRIMARLPKFDGSGVRGTHPDWLIQDESSFYPEPAWKELIETLIINDDPEHDNSRWFSHGVTVGPGNTFDDKISGKDSTWEVVPLPAMYRPNWSDKERQDKIIEYGGEDSPDYRRNVKGLSANAGTPLLVMHRLMEAVDSDEMSAYNLEEYSICNINDAQVREVGSILDLFDPPISHTKYGKVWIGMDYGLTTSNSCLVIFAETKEKGDDHGRLRLLSKITLTRIPTEDQVDLIKHIMEIYRPTAFVFDAHGIGQPAYDWLQKEVREDENVAWMLDRIKGYSFSKKMIVQFDPNIEISEDDPDGWKAAAIERLGSEASIDSLRLMVDSHRLRLPYDKDLIGELQAVQRKEPVRFDEYGKPKRKQGQHTLDAIRFALLGYNQHVIEEIVKSYEDSWSPPEMIIMDYI